MLQRIVTTVIVGAFLWWLTSDAALSAGELLIVCLLIVLSDTRGELFLPRR